MAGLSSRTKLIVWLAASGIGLALFFGGEYRAIPFPVGWLGTCLFVAAVWLCVGLIHRIPHSDEEAQIAPGEWQAWVGIAFVGAVLIATIVKMHVFLPEVPIGHNPDASATGRSIGTLFVAWLVLVHVLKKRWTGTVLEDERDVRIQLVAGQAARTVTAVCVIGIAVLLGFSDTARLREFSYPYIAQLLMQGLLWGALVEQLAKAILYWRDRRAMGAAAPARRNG
jgi:uncharacterized membrane protein